MIFFFFPGRTPTWNLKMMASKTNLLFQDKLSFKLNFRGAHVRLWFQRSIFTPKIGAQMKQNSTIIFGIFASADAEK